MESGIACFKFIEKFLKSVLLGETLYLVDLITFLISFPLYFRNSPKKSIKDIWGGFLKKKEKKQCQN